MPISGLVIQIDPEQRDTVVADLEAIEALELTPTQTGEPLVVVLDVPTIRDEEELYKQIDSLPGVRQVSLSYHNFEDLEDSRPN